jgi:hypothetical protein
VWHPDDETLVDVALGEAADDGLAQHIATCPVCAATVQELVRTLELTRQGAGNVDWHAAPSGLWDRIDAEIQLDRADSARPITEPIAEPMAEPIDKVEHLASRRQPRSKSQRWSGRSTWVLGAAAAGAAIGLLAGRAVWGTDPAPAATTVASAELDTLDTRQRLGAASLVRSAGDLDLQLDTPALDAGNGYLEVWLINRDGKRMVSVGVLRGVGPASFPISQQLIDQGYVVVDVSKEGFDDEPRHSGDSLLRGTLNA